jgi:hypothetical protein
MTPKKLKVSPFEAKTLSWWKTRRAKIDMDPPYQRQGRLWSDTDKAYLIDSIINGFDVPKLYVADFTFGDSKLNRKKLPYAIIDGKQRLEAIFDFFDGLVTLNEDFDLRENPSLKLGGLGYQDLRENHAEIAESFENFNLSVMSVITDSSELINELFVRLNRSKPLTGAEVRNAMAGPAPEVIRQLSLSGFFSVNCAFQMIRGQDKNAAAKFLLFEYHDALKETKKGALDAFVKESAQHRKHLELAGRRVEEMLDVLQAIFLPKDKLLASAGVVPVYYWFVRSLRPRQYPQVREFLLRFEGERKRNREIAAGGTGQRVNKKLLQYDQYNRSTNDLVSHEGRVQILLERFEVTS